MDFAVDYQLVNDNLCDFSHVAYVHADTFGKEFVGKEKKDKFSDSQPDIELLPNGVCITRIIKGIEGKKPGGPEKVDLLILYYYLLPGVLLMDGTHYPAGTLDNYISKDKIEAEPESISFNAQAITPMDEGNLRYFFSTCMEKEAPDQAMEFVYQLTVDAFAEEKKMIEAQHHSIKENPIDRLAVTSHEKAAVYFRKLVKESSMASA